MSKVPGIITAAIVVGDMDIILNDLSFYTFISFVYEVDHAIKIWHANRQELRRFEQKNSQSYCT